jgi:hypothetical protein
MLEEIKQLGALTRANQNSPEDAVGYPIDEQFVEMRFRHIKRVFVVIWIVAQIWLWCWYFLPPAKSHSFISIVFMDIGCTLLFLFVLWMAPSRVSRASILMTQTRLAVLLPGVFIKEIAISRENPVVTRKDASGKNWVLSSSAGASNPLKVPCDAYPHLETFIAEAPGVLDGTIEPRAAQDTDMPEQSD